MPGTSPSVDSCSLTRPTQLFPITRQLSYRVTPLLVPLPLTPNHITALSLAAGLGAAWCFILGTWVWGVAGGVLMILCYTLDNCDGEIARIKMMSSEWGARFDDLADWLVDSAFFAGLGYGTWATTDDVIWLWLGLAAAAGATIDYAINLVLFAREKKNPRAKTREEVARAARQPENTIDWLIYVFHKLSRTDFCVIVFGLALFDITWILLPLGAVGAQAFWMTDLSQRARGWHT